MINRSESELIARERANQILAKGTSRKKPQQTAGRRRASSRTEPGGKRRG